MKRSIGVFLLLLANIVILAHAVVPHHHDGGAVSICNIFSIRENFEHDHFGRQPHHSSDDFNHHQANEDCILSSLYFSFNQDKQQDESSDKTSCFNYWSHYTICAFITTPDIEIQNYGNLPFRQKPYIDLYYYHYITHSLGLRAPPSC